MLRLVKAFDLQKDVFPKIPASRLEIPFSKLRVDENTHLTFETCGLAIVGQEKSGHILVTYNGFDQGKNISFIDIYDTKLKVLKNVYKHREIMHCINASISSEHSLLAFTIEVDETPPKKPKLVHSNSMPTSNSNLNAANPSQNNTNSSGKKRRSDENTKTYFQTLLAEVREGGMSFKLNAVLPLIQRVQFLSTEGSKVVYLLFFFDKKFINLIQVNIKKQSNGFEITTRPSLINYIVRNYIWYEWDPYRNYLYVLQKLDLDQTPFYGESDPAYRMVSLKLFEFTDHRAFRMLWEVPLRMKCSLPKYYIHNHSLYRGFDHRASSAISEFIHIVALDGNAFCLCQQHPVLDTYATSIKISIFLLHTKGKLDLHIPMNNVEFQVIVETRVFFGAIGNMLLIYVPGYYFQMIDCGAEHPPCFGICSPGLATPLAKVTKAKSGKSKVKADVISKYYTPVDSSDLRGHYLFDCREGILYEYLLDREAILHLFKSKKVELRCQALHLVISHMKDEELLEQIMTHIFTRHPTKVSSALLSEFLISAPYISFKKSYPGNPLLSILPVTSLPQLKYHMLYSDLHGYHVFPSPTSLVIREKEQLKPPPRYAYEVVTLTNSTENVPRYVDHPPIQTPKTFHFFKSFFSLSQSPPAQPDISGNIGEFSDFKDSLEDATSSLYKGSVGFEEYLTNHFMNCYPRSNRIQILKLVRDFRRKIVIEVNKLFKYIQKGLEADITPQVIYQILEDFYCALEELYYPSPCGFSHLFVTYGERCLPRNVFLQYVERGVFNLTEEFLEKTVDKLNSENNDDIMFKYELFSSIKMESKNRCFELMSSQSEYAKYVLQQCVSNVHLGNSENMINLERTNDSPFIPRTVFLDSISAHFEREQLSPASSFSSLIPISHSTPSLGNNNNSNLNTTLSGGNVSLTSSGSPRLVGQSLSATLSPPPIPSFLNSAAVLSFINDSISQLHSTLDSLEKHSTSHLNNNNAALDNDDNDDDDSNNIQINVNNNTTDEIIQGDED